MFSPVGQLVVLRASTGSPVDVADAAGADGVDGWSTTGVPSTGWTLSKQNGMKDGLANTSHAVSASSTVIPAVARTMMFRKLRCRRCHVSEAA